jgi:TP901 family phage tail tape measure protein
MADEIRSELIFEAQEAINTLQRIASELIQYNQAVIDAASGTRAFTTSGARFDRQAASAASSMKKLSSASKEAAQSIRSLRDVELDLRNAFRDETMEARELKREMADTTNFSTRIVEARKESARQAQQELKQQLLLNQAARKQAAIRARAADPLGRAPVRGQAAIEATVSRIRSSQRDAEVAQQKLRDNARQTEIALRNAFRGSADGAEDLGKRLKRTGEEGKKAGNSITLSWRSVVRIFAVQTAHRIVTLLSNAFRDGIRDAQAYQTALAEVRTIGRDLNLSVEELDDRVRSISDAFGQPIEVVTEGLYQTLSNQVGEASESLDFLTDANKFAVAAVTDTGSAVNLLSSAINAFGLDVRDTGITAAKFFRTIELGRVRAEEMADTFGRVAVLSNQLGISLDETLASIATLTVQGLRFNEAFTLITNTQLKLIRPTEALKDIFEELGVVSAEAGIQAFGFQGLLERIAETGGATATELGEVFGRVRAIRGVLGLATDQAEDFDDVLTQIQETKLNDLEEAFQKIFVTDAQKFKRELNELRNVFVAGFGQSALRIINTVSSTLGGAADAVKNLAIGVGTAAGVFVTYRTAVAAATLATKAFELGVLASTKALFAFARTPLGAALTLGAIVAGIAFAYDGLTVSIREATIAQNRLTNEATRDAITAEKERQRVIIQNASETLSRVQRILIERNAAFTAANRDIIRLETVAGQKIVDQFKNRLSALQALTNASRDSIRSAATDIRQLQAELQSAGDELEQFNFARAIRGLTPARQALAGIQRSQEFLQASNEALAQGDIERAKRLQEISESAAKTALSTADQVGNVALRNRAESAVRDSLTKQSQIIDAQINKRKEERQVAQDQLTATERLVTEFEALTNELTEFNKRLAEGDLDFDIEKAKNRLEEIGERSEEILQEAGEKASLLAKTNEDFEILIHDIQTRFVDTLEGTEIDLTDAITINFDRVLTRAKKRLGEFAPGEVAAIGALGISEETFIKGPEEATKQITELNKQFE